MRTAIYILATVATLAAFVLASTLGTSAGVTLFQHGLPFGWALLVTVAVCGFWSLTLGNLIARGFGRLLELEELAR